MPPSRSLTAMAVLAALAASACGGGSTGAGPSGEPTASAPDATAPPPDATQPGTGPVTTPTTTATTPPQTTPRDGSGASGGGGEEAVRVPATFTVVGGGRLTPPAITVPPFLAVEISVVAGDGRPHVLVVRTPAPQTLRVAAGRRAAVRIPGLRAGRYTVLLDGRRAGALVAGGEVGP